jgi:AraC-like DNA-binding protein
VDPVDWSAEHLSVCDAQLQRNAFLDRRHPGLHSLVRGLRFRAAANVLAGAELMHMIRKGQFTIGGVGTSVADRFYALSGLVRPALSRGNARHGKIRLALNNATEPKLRLAEASRLLVENTSASIAEIAYSVGYKNSSYFIKLFKEEYQCMPKAFRDACKKDAREPAP